MGPGDDRGHEVDHDVAGLGRGHDHRPLVGVGEHDHQALVAGGVAGLGEVEVVAPSVDDAAEAIDPLERYVQMVAGDAEALKLLGIAKFQEKDYHTAITHLNRAGQLAPRDAEVHLYRSRYFFLFQKPRQGWEELRIALAKDSTNTQVLYSAGVLYYEKDDPVVAQRYLKRLVEARPTYWQAYRYLGFIAEQQADYAAAEHYYRVYLQNILEADPEVQQRLNSLSRQFQEP